MDNKKSRYMLYKFGFNEDQVEDLRKLRAAYATKEIYITPADQRRMEFVRWLVSTGRLSETVKVK